MIKFGAAGTQLEMDINTGVDIDECIWVAKFDTQEDVSAIVMADYLNDRLDRIMTSVRARAYEQGWKDAKAKSRRQCAFSCRLPDAPEREVRDGRA